MLPSRLQRLVIITGLSGSGKTSVVHALEDQGFFCVDNLPVALLPGLLDLVQDAEPRLENIAAVMDVRDRNFLSDYGRAFGEVRGRGIKPEILFLDASTEVLLRRFEETGRPHPLAGSENLLAGIERERAQLFGLQQSSDRVIDTSRFNIHQIRRYVGSLYAEAEQKDRRLAIELLSFGYAKGIPLHMSLIMDVRFLPNPHYDPELRTRDGRDASVQEAIRGDQRASDILDGFMAWIEKLIAFYEAADRAYFNLGVGCTGGRHRSVAVVCMLAERLRTLGYSPQVWHRDVD